ncbi:TQO small subunit DoxD [Mycolicibacter senuensis]|uniref:Putative terminal quinol oxidase, subunit I n=1 Tax=Mycolicibacter senuensis TaxID=386913 RepID=A0A7I9XPD8_9MYCO|nr:TQO small subunit DoxD [Mycolicibacter senuensis]MDQ2627958.1 quinol oxidase [Actinomycetota bacterium]ORW69740.1 quinol oxidase [Mycolicibacter senuensis]GFG71784.1 putative terminal quinol oxidase, subunit I [Mycolicibacter senuensis]
MTADTIERTGTIERHFATAGLFALPVRLVIGWTYFSAFWRRVGIADKLDPDVPGYIGEKFNHFLPQALGIGPIIEHLLTHPGLLAVAMTVFTIVEGVVGICVMIGLLTRVMSLAVLGLAFGILLSAGWLGTTCLDEWQIGILGMACGFMLFLSGGGRYCVDRIVSERIPRLAQQKWFNWLSSGAINVRTPVVVSGSILILAAALFTNQHFHGGIYGPLHNKSVAPVIEITDAHIADNRLQFELFRTEGADVYGSFVIGVSVRDDTTGDTVVQLDGTQLSRLPEAAIANRYVAKVKPGAHSLVVPLGAKAQLSIDTGPARWDATRQYTLILTDISGATWEQAVSIGP